MYVMHALKKIMLQSKENELQQADTSFLIWEAYHPPQKFVIFIVIIADSSQEPGPPPITEIKFSLGNVICKDHASIIKSEDRRKVTYFKFLF